MKHHTDLHNPYIYSIEYFHRPPLKNEGIQSSIFINRLSKTKGLNYFDHNYLTFFTGALSFTWWVKQLGLQYSLSHFPLKC